MKQEPETNSAEKQIKRNLGEKLKIRTKNLWHVFSGKKM